MQTLASTDATQIHTPEKTTDTDEIAPSLQRAYQPNLVPGRWRVRAGFKAGIVSTVTMARPSFFKEVSTQDLTTGEETQALIKEGVTQAHTTEEITSYISEVFLNLTQVNVHRTLEFSPSKAGVVTGPAMKGSITTRWFDQLPSNKNFQKTYSQTGAWKGHGSASSQRSSSGQNIPSSQETASSQGTASEQDTTSDQDTSPEEAQGSPKPDPTGNTAPHTHKTPKERYGHIPAQPETEHKRPGMKSTNLQRAHRKQKWKEKQCSSKDEQITWTTETQTGKDTQKHGQPRQELHNPDEADPMVPYFVHHQDCGLGGAQEYGEGESCLCLRSNINYKINTSGVQTRVEESQEQSRSPARKSSIVDESQEQSHHSKLSQMQGSQSATIRRSEFQAMKSTSVRKRRSAKLWFLHLFRSFICCL